MQIVVSGASGLVGSKLVASLVRNGHRVIRLVRSQELADGEGRRLWRPDQGELDPQILEGADAVVNLAGRNIADGRWNAKVKQELRASRVDGTLLLARAIARCEVPPAVLVNASATGYYGDRGEEELDEGAAAGSSFLARLVSDWEAAAQTAAPHCRVVMLRFGVVLAAGGGALHRMLLPFRLGLGGPLGSGRQWWSWVAMEDVVGVLRLALANADLQGPVNVVAPHASRCRDFARTLGRVLRRPALLPAPAIALRLALGEMADELLLASARVRPVALETAGYDFVAPHLEDALRRILG